MFEFDVNRVQICGYHYLSISPVFNLLSKVVALVVVIMFLRHYVKEDKDCLSFCLVSSHSSSYLPFSIHIFIVRYRNIVFRLLYFLFMFSLLSSMFSYMSVGLFKSFIENFILYQGNMKDSKSDQFQIHAFNLFKNNLQSYVHLINFFLCGWIKFTSKPILSGLLHKISGDHRIWWEIMTKMFYSLSWRAKFAISIRMIQNSWKQIIKYMLSFLPWKVVMNFEEFYDSWMQKNIHSFIWQAKLSFTTPKFENSQKNLKWVQSFLLSKSELVKFA